MRAFRSPSPACERARDWVSLRLDCELSEFERALLKGHLERCASCAEFARTAAAVSFALRAAPLERPSRPFVLPSRRRRVLRPLTGIAAAAVIAVAVGLGTLVGSFGSGTPQVPGRAGNAGEKVAGPIADDNTLLREVRLAQLKANARSHRLQHGLGIPV